MTDKFTKGQQEVYSWIVKRINYTPNLSEAYRSLGRLKAMPENSRGRAIWQNVEEMSELDRVEVIERVREDWGRVGWKV